MAAIQLSVYYIALEIRTNAGMMIAIDTRDWQDPRKVRHEGVRGDSSRIDNAYQSDAPEEHSV